MPPALTGGRVLFFALAAATPLTVVALGTSPAYAGGLLVVPLGLAFLIFAAGYGAMTRRAPNAGALYAIVARGLGRPLGIAAAWIALLSYGALQIAMLGLVVVFLPVELPFWQVALAGWLLVGLLGLVRVQVVAGVLAVLVLAEIVVLVGFGVANALEPVGGLAITLPAHLDRPVLGLALVAAALTFVGVETTAAYSEETRRPRRSIARATALAVLLLTVLYAGSAWATNAAAGAAAHGPELIFDLAAARLAPWAVTVGRVVLLTGLLAGVVALHHTLARYLHALGRDHVLPARLAGIRRGSLLQSVLIGLVLLALVLFGPAAGPPRWVGVSAGIGVLVLVTASSLAALMFLNRSPGGENAWRRFVAPGLATVAFGTLAYLAFANLGDLLGAGRQTWILPAACGAAVLLGISQGLILRRTQPIAYAGIGLGGTAVVISPTSLPIPKPRTPGAHRPERINTT